MRCSGCAAATAGAWLILLGGTWMGSDQTWAEDSERISEVYWHNDALVNSDDMFTQGLSVAVHSTLAANLDGTRGTPAFGKRLAGMVLPSEPGLHYRESWSIGHNIQTPDDLWVSELIPDDAPYVGMVAWSNTFTAFDDRRFTGLGTMIGWVGDSAGGERIQNLAHDLRDRTDPQGWDNQLRFEPLLNVYFGQKRKLWTARRLDLSMGFELAAGNFVSYGEASVEIRIGHAPAGFAPIVPPIGMGLVTDSTMRQPGTSYRYVTVVLRARAIANDLLLDGNTFRDDAWTDGNTVEPRHLIGQLVVGLHHDRIRWGVRVNFVYGTRAVESADAFRSNPYNSYGTVTLHWNI